MTVPLDPAEQPQRYFSRMHPFCFANAECEQPLSLIIEVFARQGYPGLGHLTLESNTKNYKPVLFRNENQHC